MAAKAACQLKMMRNKHAAVKVVCIVDSAGWTTWLNAVERSRRRTVGGYCVLLEALRCFDVFMSRRYTPSVLGCFANNEGTGHTTLRLRPNKTAALGKHGDCCSHRPFESAANQAIYLPILSLTFINDFGKSSRCSSTIGNALVRGYVPAISFLNMRVAHHSPTCPCISSVFPHFTMEGAQCIPFRHL